MFRTTDLSARWHGISERRFDAACLLAALSVVAYLVSVVVLNTFYHFGALSDAVSFSALIWHNGWDLMQAPAISPGTFFNTHISWFFWFPSAISWLLPCGRIPYLAWVTGLSHALLGFGFWLLLDALCPSRHKAASLLKGLAAFAFALNGHSQSLLLQTHLEILGPAFSLLFLWGLARGDRPVAAVSFVLALSQREDMGFHLFGLLFLVAALDLLRGMPRAVWRPVAIYAGLALLYGVGAFAVKALVFQDWGIFREHYIGVPPFHHLTFDLLQARLDNLLLGRYWIWGPGLVALLWAAATGNLYLLLGWLAFFPWLALSLAAAAQIVGDLDLHYGYPFLIAGAWPLLAGSRLFTEPRGLEPTPPKAAIAWVAALVLIQQPVSVYPSLEFRSYWLLPVPTAELAAAPAYSAFEREFSHALIPDFRADIGVFGIAPYAVDIWADGIRSSVWNEAVANFDPKALPEKDVDAVFYFTEGYSEGPVADLIAYNRLDHHYWLPGTKLYFSTSLDINRIGKFNELFVPADPLPPEVTSAEAAAFRDYAQIKAGQAPSSPLIWKKSIPYTAKKSESPAKTQ